MPWASWESLAMLNYDESSRYTELALAANGILHWPAVAEQYLNLLMNHGL